jgi:predicted transposase/invertase (TIGR01784 family)
LEIHFIEMTKFRTIGERDIRLDDLHRWLTYLDPKSPKELVEEVIKMDIAIQEAETKLRTVTRDAEALRLYEIREKAMYDWTSGVNQARREGKAEVARNMLNEGLSLDIIHRVTGLDTKTIQSL